MICAARHGPTDAPTAHAEELDPDMVTIVCDKPVLLSPSTTPVAAAVDVQRATLATSSPQPKEGKRFSRLPALCCLLILAGGGLACVYGRLDKPVVTVDSLENFTMSQYWPTAITASLRSPNEFKTKWKRFDVELVLSMDGSRTHTVARFKHSGEVNAKAHGKIRVSLDGPSTVFSPGFDILRSQCYYGREVQVKLRGTVRGRPGNGLYLEKNILSKWTTVPCLL